MCVKYLSSFSWLFLSSRKTEGRLMDIYSVWQSHFKHPQSQSLASDAVPIMCKYNVNVKSVEAIKLKTGSLKLAAYFYAQEKRKAMRLSHRSVFLVDKLQTFKSFRKWFPVQKNACFTCSKFVYCGVGEVMENTVNLEKICIKTDRTALLFILWKRFLVDFVTSFQKTIIVAIVVMHYYVSSSNVHSDFTSEIPSAKDQVNLKSNQL